MADKTYADGTPIQEYPKMIYNEDGSKVIVSDKSEEDAHTGVEVAKPSKSEEDKKDKKAKDATQPAWKTE